MMADGIRQYPDSIRHQVLLSLYESPGIAGSTESQTVPWQASTLVTDNPTTRRERNAEPSRASRSSEAQQA